MRELPILFSGPMVRAILEGTKTQTRRAASFPVNGRDFRPRYQVGDVVWVRETWAPCDCGHCDGAIYRANGEPPVPVSWKSGRFMPKKYARLWLRVTDVRAQRLQDITEADAVAEGVGVGFQMNAGWPDYRHIKNGICELSQDTAVMSFATLWDSINGKLHPWETNDWVWAYTFERIEYIWLEDS